MLSTVWKFLTGKIGKWILGGIGVLAVLSLVFSFLGFFLMALAFMVVGAGILESYRRYGWKRATQIGTGGLTLVSLIFGGYFFTNYEVKRRVIEGDAWSVGTTVEDQVVTIGPGVTKTIRVRAGESFSFQGQGREVVQRFEKKEVGANERLITLSSEVETKVRYRVFSP